MHGGDRTMIEEKWLIGKYMFNFKLTVMREPDHQRITLYWGFKLFKILRILKLLSGIIYTFSVLISFQANVFFLYQSIEV